MKSKIIFFSLIISLFIAVVNCKVSEKYFNFFSKYFSETLHYEIKNDIQKRVMIFNNTQDNEWNINMKTYVSIAQLDNNYFVIANYTDLLLLDKNKATLTVLKPIGLKGFRLLASSDEISATLKNEKPAQAIYMPTGVFIDSTNNVYIANYKGDNVLQGKINTETKEITLLKSYASKNARGPENVIVDEAKNMLISANYDSGTVTAFNLQTGDELWSSRIEQAHGVCILGDKVYATGLIERKIYELNLINGEIIRSQGTLGWDPARDQFMWPTSIFPYDKKTLVVSDAQSGFISFIDKKTLKVTRYMGGNGPSYRWFNYPYAAVPINNGMVVLSSLRGNILFLDKTGKIVEDNLISFEDKWPIKAANSAHFGDGWTAYINNATETIRIRDRTYKLGFGNLHPTETGPILRVPDINTLFNSHHYLYFLQGFRSVPEVNLFFSSSSATLLGIVNDTHYSVDLLVNKKISSDSWLYERDIINTFGKISVDKVIDELKEKKHIFDTFLVRHGWISHKNLKEMNIFSNSVEKFDNVFVSDPGRQFKIIYDQCDDSFCDVKKLKQAANEYYRKVDGYAYLNLDEYLLVGMLSGG